MVLLGAIVLILLIWPYSTKIITSGHVGVFYRIFGGTVTDRNYGEGLHFFLPWNRMFVYDCRVQREDFSVSALSKGGLQIKVELSALYNVIKKEAPELQIRVGPDYTKKVIVPGAIFAVRGIVGNLHQSDIYANNPLQIQEKVFELMGDALKKNHTSIKLHGILVRKIILPEKMTAAIETKHEAEQIVYQERYQILQAYERYKKVFLEASTVRMAQNLINEGLTPEYLRYTGIKATRELAASPNAKLVIVGGKDGLPLLLNPDTLRGGTTDSPRADPGLSQAPEKTPQFDMPALSVLEKNLNKLDEILMKANGDKTDKVLTALPEQLLERNNFFRTSTASTEDNDITPLQQSKPQEDSP